MDEFRIKIEEFFYYLTFAIMIEPESCGVVNDKLVSFTLPPDKFFKLLNKYYLEYPYKWDVEIILIKNLIKKSNLDLSDCKVIIDSCKSNVIYSNPMIFNEQIERIEATTGEKYGKAFQGYLEHLKSKRDEIIESLYEVVKPIKNKPHEKHPFKDEKTFQLFNYIVEKWSYNRDQKWADIWNVIKESEKYKLPYQNEYEKYVRLRFKYTGKFQYDKIKKDDNRDNQSLLELIENFSKK